MGDENGPTRRGGSRRTRTRAALVLKLTLLTMSVLLALGIAEVAVRVLSLAPEVKAIWISDEGNVYKRSTNPILGFELKANYRNENPNLNNSFPSTNAHGQRDVDRSIEKPEGVRRIVLLGDSVVEGHGIMDVDDTMSRQLEMLYADGRTEVLNFGVSGYCTLSEIELLETKALAFDPDVVVLVFVNNDLLNFNPVAFELDAAVERPAIVKHLFIRSHLFRLASIRLNLYQLGVDADPATWNDEAIGDNNVVVGLARLKDLAQRHGFQTIIAICPGTAGGEIVDGPFMPDGDELVIERLAKMYGIGSFRLSEFLRSYVTRSSRRVGARDLYLTGDQIHPSPLGCRAIALALNRVLADVPKYAPARPPASSADLAAIEAAAEWGSEEPNYAKVHNNAGRRLREAGRMAEAIVEFRKALELDPDLSEAHFNLGFVYHRQRQLEEAKTSYLESLVHRDDNEEAHYNLALIYLDETAFDDAERHLRKALAIKPGYAEAYVILGNLRSRQERPEEARASYLKAIELAPDDVSAHNNLGNNRLGQEDYPKAIEHYRRAIEIAPDYFMAHHNLAYALELTGRIDEAIREYREALRIRPDSPETRRALERLLEAKPGG